MSAIIDDKSEHCIPFILDRIKAHRALHGENARPFFLGLNGVQGAGKTTLVRMQSTRHSGPLAAANSPHSSRRSPPSAARSVPRPTRSPPPSSASTTST